MPINSLIYGNILLPALDTYQITPNALRDKINHFPLLSSSQLECWAFINLTKKNIFTLSFDFHGAQLVISCCKSMYYQRPFTARKLIDSHMTHFLLETITVAHEQGVQYTWLDQAPHLLFVFYTVHRLTIHTTIHSKSSSGSAHFSLIELVLIAISCCSKSFAISCLYNFFTLSLNAK